MPASGNNDFTDDYVTELLKRDAKAVSSSSSLSSLLNKSSRSANPPKPNTRFLRNILRDTDNHNSALLAKEAQESKLRLDKLRHAHRPAQQLYSARDRHDPKRRRLDPIEHKSSPERNLSSHRRRSPEPKALASRSARRDTSPDRRRSSQHHRREPRSPDRTHRESTRRRRHSSHRSSSPRNRHTFTRPSRLSDNSHRRKRSRSPLSDASDSDPLEAIIGPAPPINPRIRSKGRGVQNNASTIDNHFSSNYDPSADLQPDPDNEDSLDWDQALEALRDRQKWKQQGAERLRAAGFSEKHVTKWEKGGEKSEEDVVWAKKGEGREWDRGKVIDEHGLVDVKPEWGRLKDS
ncbi:hypothetical protein E4T43_02667 [Aureobasidium subglaciale]|nr:hypothetical protein E4T43_02667 [Aureobasidium subglaciale]